MRIRGDKSEPRGGCMNFRKAWEYLVEFHFHFIPLSFLLLPLLGLIPSGRRQAGKNPLRPWRWERLL